MIEIKRRIENYTKSKENVYIIPSRKGMRFIFINFSLFIIAMAYTNNMALLISFFAFAYFIIQMLEIHKIVNSAQLASSEIKNTFFKSPHQAIIKVRKPLTQTRRSFLEVTIECQKKNLKAKFDKSINDQTYQFSLKIPHRGHYTSERIKFHTTGGTGLFYVWRYYKVQLDFFSYPEKKYISKQNLHVNSQEKMGLAEVEFHSHIPYSAGLNSKRIDWKVYARSDQLFWKKHVDHHSTTYEVNYAHLHGNKEEKLSYMSFLINRYHQDKKSWKLVLPNLVLNNNSGFNHYHRSLEALSAF